MELCFIETKIFSSVIGLLLKEEEYLLLQMELIKNPKKGDVIQGTGGARKIRIGAQGRGKRGGSRIIYYFQDTEGKIWLLAAYKKNKKSDITKDESKWIAKYVAEIKEVRK